MRSKHWLAELPPRLPVGSCLAHDLEVCTTATREFRHHNPGVHRYAEQAKCPRPQGRRLFLVSPPIDHGAEHGGVFKDMVQSRLWRSIRRHDNRRDSWTETVNSMMSFRNHYPIRIIKRCGIRRVVGPAQQIIKRSILEHYHHDMLDLPPGISSVHVLLPFAIPELYFEK